MAGCLEPVGALPDTGSTDAGVDGGLDARVDARTDATADTNIDAPIVDAGFDVPAFDAGFDTGDPCVIGPPLRPGPFDDEDDRLTVAIRNIVFDQRESWQDIGWDLDNQCTDADSPALCRREGPLPLDGPGGSDNAFGQHLIPLIMSFRPTAETEIQDRMTQNEPIVIDIKRFNFTQNDPLVDCELSSANGHFRFDDLPPQWDGNDFWSRSRDSFQDLVGMEIPLVQDPNAYVNEGMLVMRLPNRQPVFLPWIGGHRIALRFFNGLITGQLNEDFSRIDDVILQGVVADSDLLAAFDDAGLCGSGLRPDIETELADHLDIGLSGGACNAISVAFRLSGTRAGRTPDLIDPPANIPGCFD